MLLFFLENAMRKVSPLPEGKLPHLLSKKIGEYKLTGMIGKGKRGPEVVAAMKEFGAVYFGAIGGCGALLAKCIKKCEVVAYDDLGPEAIHRLEVVDFPVTVVIDSLGNDLYVTGRQAWLERKG